MKFKKLILILAVTWAGLAGAWAQPAEPAAPEPPPAMPEVEIEDFGDERPQEMVVFGRDVILKPGERAREVVVIGGSARIDGEVEGDVVVVLGSAEINGPIGGELVVVGGNARFGPDGKVDRDTVVVGGELTATADQIGGDRQEIRFPVHLPQLRWLRNWVSQGLMLGRPLPHQFGWWWVFAWGLLLLNVLVVLVARRPTEAVAEALATNPIGSFGVGLLIYLLIGPVVLLLMVSVIGLIVIPFAVCAMILSFVLGKVAVYQTAGQQIGKQLSARAFESPVVAVIVGTLLFYLVYMIPVLGLLAWGMIAPFAMGAVMIALVRSGRSSRPADSLTAPPVPLHPQGYTPGLAPAAPVNLSPSGMAAEPAAAATAVSAPALAPPALPHDDIVMAPRVGFWLRVWATFLDFLIIAGLTAVIAFLPLGIILWLTYHVAMWSWKGTTIGGIIMGLKIVRKDGAPINFAVALVRALAAVLSAFVLFIGFFWAGWDREKQAWHDKIAGTLVVRVPKGMSLI